MAEQTTASVEGLARKADHLAASIDTLREPYRRNTIHWLEQCTERRFENLGADLAEFLVALHPDMREVYFNSLKMILDDAVRYFGSLP